MGEVGIAHHRADPQGAIGEALDAIEPRQARDIDQPRGADDVALHQVEQVGAGGEIGRAGFARGGDGLGYGRRAYIIEPVHAARSVLVSARIFCASCTASVIPA